VDEVIYYLGNIKEFKKRGTSEVVKGSSAKINEVLNNFTNLLKQEIELELGISFAALSPQHQNLLKIAGETNNSAKKLTESKRRILNLNKQKSQSNVSDEKKTEQRENQERIESENSLELERLAQEIKEREEQERLTRERIEKEAQEKREQEEKERELKIREQDYDNLLKEIEISDNPEAISLDINYESLRNNRTRVRLETTKKNRQDALEKERQEQRLRFQIEAYDKLLGDIKNAGNSDKLKEFNKKIDDFNYDNLPDDKNKDLLKAA
jgi:hypothetical protein